MEEVRTKQKRQIEVEIKRHAFLEYLPKAKSEGGQT